MNQTFNFRTASINENEYPLNHGDLTNFHSIVGGGDGSGKVAVVNDSGIDPTHKDLQGIEIERIDVNNFGSEPRDAVGHGTACAAIIANIAPGVDKIIDLPIFNKRSVTGFQYIENSYDWMLNNKSEYDVVNMSWGANKKIDQIDKIHNHLAEDKVCMVAAGNTGDDGGSPATAEKAFSVGACGKNGKMAEFSSFNPNLENPEISALGKNIQLARADGTSMGKVLSEEYVQSSGTSFAAPIMTGSHLRAISSESSNDFPQSFIDNATNIPETPEDGAGYLNFEDSVSEPRYPQWLIEYIKYLKERYGR